MIVYAKFDYKLSNDESLIKTKIGLTHKTTIKTNELCFKNVKVILNIWYFKGNQWKRKEVILGEIRVAIDHSGY